MKNFLEFQEQADQIVSTQERNKRDKERSADYADLQSVANKQMAKHAHNEFRTTASAEIKKQEKISKVMTGR
jgi:hypothetical protein